MHACSAPPPPPHHQSIIIIIIIVSCLEKVLLDEEYCILTVPEHRHAHALRFLPLVYVCLLLRSEPGRKKLQT